MAGPYTRFSTHNQDAHTPRKVQGAPILTRSGSPAILHLLFSGPLGADAMKGWAVFVLLSLPLALAVILGCESTFVTADRPSGANELGEPHPRLTKDARPQEALSAGKFDLATLPVGAPCRIDLVRPVGKGQAYQGKVVRIEKDAIVLSDVISEGPMKRSRSPAIHDLLSLRMPWSGGEETIGWQRLPDKELRIARSEIAAARVLDHDPIVDYYER